MTITIHEFSTGIRVEGTANSWLSARFTGNYMNATLDPIPLVVQNAISNQLFAVSEGDATNTPAIVGREVQENSEAWSVLAIVTRATDKQNRPIAVYRYFLAEGKGKLEDLLRWHVQANQPVFNPFDVKQVGEFITYNPSVNPKRDLLTKPEYQDLLKSSEPTVIVPDNFRCTPLILHELATRIVIKAHLVNYYKSKNYQLTPQEIDELIIYQMDNLSNTEKFDFVKKFYTQQYANKKPTQQEIENFISTQVQQMTPRAKQGAALIYLVQEYKKNYPNITDGEAQQYAQDELNNLDAKEIEDYAETSIKVKYKREQNQYKLTESQLDKFLAFKASSLDSQNRDKYIHQHFYLIYKEKLFLFTEQEIALLVNTRVANYDYVLNCQEMILANACIAWAYNIKGLNEPATFQAVFPNSANSANRLRQQINDSLVRVPSLPSNNPLITSIRNIISQGNIKSPYVTVLESSFNNSSFNAAFWQDFFQSLGLENAQKDATCSPNSVRLLMLRALAIPDTLPEFIAWVKEKARNKQLANSLGEANKLSQDLKNQLPQDSATIKQAKQGIDSILVGSNDQALQDLVDWIDRDSQGLWGKAYQEYCIDFWKDIGQIAENYKTAKEDAHKKGLYLVEDQISPALKNGGYYFSHAPKNLEILSQNQWKLLRDDIIELIWTFKANTQYVSLNNPQLCSELADIFAGMSYLKQLEISEKSLEATRNLALLFTGLTNPKGIPAKLWKNCLPNLKKDVKYILKTQNNLKIMPIRKIPRIATNIGNYTLSQSLTNKVLPVGAILALILIAYSVNEFINYIRYSGYSGKEGYGFKTHTTEALDKIVIDFAGDLGKGREETKAEIEKIFSNANPETTLDYDDKYYTFKMWVSSIKKYQKNAKLEASGIIQTNDETDRFLRCQLYQNFGLPADSKTQQNCQKFDIVLPDKREEPKPSPSPSPPPKKWKKEWQTNVYSLNALVWEINTSHPVKSLEIVQFALAKILSRDTKPYEELIDPTQAEELMDLVKKYQGDKYGKYADGRIDPKGITYHRLKCDVAKELNIKLKDPPSMCPEL